MNLAVERVGRGRGWQRLPSILVRSFVVPTHVPKSVKDTSVTAHCHAATAQLTREYQSDHRRHVLIPGHDPRCPPTPSDHHLLDKPFHIRSAERACERSCDWRRGAAGSPDPDALAADPHEECSPDPELVKRATPWTYDLVRM